MAVPVNSFKAALAARRLQIGLWQGLASPITAEICASAGYDWLLFDGEHSPNTVPTLMSALQAVSRYPVHAAARPPAGEPRLIKQYLDIGFTSLLIPMVDTPDQARSLVEAVRFPPRGRRGVAVGVRASQWGAVSDYLTTADEQICLMVQAETPLALDNLADIAAVEGVDGVFIGPADLSAALGYLGQPNHPVVRAAIEGAIAAILRAGKAAGLLIANEEAARRYIDSGASFVAVGSDSAVLAQGVRDLRKRFPSG